MLELSVEDKCHPDPAASSVCKRRRLETSSPLKPDSKRPLLQIAPMLHVSDRHFRVFMRQLTSKAQLWSEMVVDQTVLHTEDLPRHLGYDDCEHPIVCQLGGSDPESLVKAATIVNAWQYDGLNLNCGCPSEKVVGCGMFGAILMRDPSLISNICHSIREALPDLPLSVKMRVGIDELDSFQWLHNCVSSITSSGVDNYVMHARPAWVNKRLSPSQNRTIPPLNYARVFDIAQAFPDKNFSINGGIQTLAEVEDLLSIPCVEKPSRSLLHGAMIGRAASDKPAFLADVDRRIYGSKSNPKSAWSRRTVLEGFADYLLRSAQCEGQLRPRHAFPLVRSVVGLFHSTPASKYFRQHLNELVKLHATEWRAGEVLGSLVDRMEENYSEILNEPLCSA